MATRCCWPPEKLGCPHVRLLDDADALERFEGLLLVGGPEEPEEREQEGRGVQATHEHVLQHGDAPDQVERLEDHADARAEPSQLRGLRPVDVHVVDEQLAAGHGHEPVDGAHEGRLAGAGEANDDDELSWLDVERHTVETDGAGRIGDGDVTERDHGTAFVGAGESRSW